MIVGKKHGSVIGTLVERQTRMIRQLHLPVHDSQTLLASLVERMSDLPPALLRSFTWDQGTEMARHNEITAALEIPRLLAVEDEINRRPGRAPADLFADSLTSPNPPVLRR